MSFSEASTAADLAAQLGVEAEKKFDVYVEVLHVHTLAAR